ncbi:unnamed protein product [Knipowitschia caucasica]
MALIEGVGDEVTLLLGGLLVLLLILLAWWSTRTEEDERAEERRPQDQVQQEDTTTPPDSAPSEALPGATGAEGHSDDGRDDSLVLRLKFLNDTERLATVRTRDTVGDIKRSHFLEEEEPRVRLIFRGQLLQDDVTVASLNLHHHSVLHCHISPQPIPRQTRPDGGAEPEVGVALNVGGLMVPLLMLMLLLLWFCQLQYRHLFTATATTSLTMLTVVLSGVAFRMYRR